MVSWHFIDRFGADVPVERVTSMQLRSNTGETVDLSGPELTQPRWVNESRTQQGPAGLVSKQLYYVVDSAVVSNASVVNRSQQRFVPWDQQRWVVQLLFYRVSFNSSDLLFAHDAGKGVELTGPDGAIRRLPFGDDGIASVSDLPRGTYSVKVYGGGVSFAQPVSISKDQLVALNMISWLDVTLLVLVVLGVALGLIVIGRPRSRAAAAGKRANGSFSSRWLRRATQAPAAKASVTVILILLVTATVLALGATRAPRPGRPVCLPLQQALRKERSNVRQPVRPHQPTRYPCSRITTSGTTRLRGVVQRSTTRCWGATPATTSRSCGNT